MHTEKQEIFDRYAQSKNYQNWDDLLMDFDIQLMNHDEFMIFMFEACDLVQKEQQKRIAENYEIDRLYGDFNDLKNSILSENNLIK